MKNLIAVLVLLPAMAFAQASGRLYEADATTSTWATSGACGNADAPRACLVIPAEPYVAGQLIVENTDLVNGYGAWSGTVVMESNIDGRTDSWLSMPMYTASPAAASTQVTSATANGKWYFVNQPNRTIRVRRSVGSVSVGTYAPHFKVWMSQDPVLHFWPWDSSGNLVMSGAVTQASGWKAPAPGVVGTQQTAAAADVTLVSAVANTRLVFADCSESAATAAAATVILRHGVVLSGTCTGNYIQLYELAPNETGDPVSLDGRGLAVASGVCMDVIAGTVDCWASTVTEAAP